MFAGFSDALSLDQGSNERSLSSTTICLAVATAWRFSTELAFRVNLFIS